MHSPSQLRSFYHQGLPVVVLLALLAWRACVECFHIYPPVGTYIAVLAFLAAVVTVFPPEHLRGKAVWIFVFLLVVVFEIRNLYRDRSAHDTEQAQIRKEERDSFAAIATAITTAITNSQKQFDATISRVGKVLDSTQAVATLAKTNLENVTGGDSFAYIVPQGSGPAIPLVLHNHGPAILSGVSIRIMRTQDPDWGNDIYKPISVGTIAPHGFSPLPVALIPKPEPKSGIDSFWIFIYAQNGMVDEMLQFRASVKSGFAYRFWVTKQGGFDRSGKPLLGPRSVKRLMDVTPWSDEPAKKNP